MTPEGLIPRVLEHQLPPPPPATREGPFWVKWIDKTLLQYFSYRYDFDPRKPDLVWTAWRRCNLPSDLKDFVHAALWYKLPVGHRQAS